MLGTSEMEIALGGWEADLRGTGIGYSRRHLSARFWDSIAYHIQLLDLLNIVFLSRHYSA